MHSYKVGITAPVLEMRGQRLRDAVLQIYTARKAPKAGCFFIIFIVIFLTQTSLRNSVIPLQEVRVRSLLREIRSHRPCSAAKKV